MTGNFPAKVTTFLTWAESHEHRILFSMPRSGRSWLGQLMRMLTGMRTPDLFREGADGHCEDDVVWVASHAAVFPESVSEGRYVLLIRDPRDVLVSWFYFDMINFGIDQVLAREFMGHVWQYRIPRLCRDWALYLASLHQTRYVLIQYESLCLYPTRLLENLRSFLGLTYLVDVDEALTRFDRKRASDFDREPEEIHTFGTPKERYDHHCCVWQRDSNLLASFNGVVLDEIGGLMELYGYMPDSHDITTFNQRLSAGDGEGSFR